MSEPFIAEVKIWAGNFAPRGWAFCQGQLLPLAQNTALFSLIGTYYGGDGRTTMGLPNLQGRAAMHAGSGSGLTPRQLGEKGGEPNVTLISAQMPSHNHNAMGAGLSANQVSPAGNTWSGSAQRTYSAGNPDQSMNPAALQPSGGGQPHNNWHPYLVLDFIIALVGIYPQRS